MVYIKVNINLHTEVRDRRDSRTSCTVMLFGIESNLRFQVIILRGVVACAMVVANRAVCNDAAKVVWSFMPAGGTIAASFGGWLRSWILYRCGPRILSVAEEATLAR